MNDARATVSEPTIPGWRVIHSDAGRFWASRVKPFPDGLVRGTGLKQPPFRTVDADTFTDLQTRVAEQENAAQEVTS
ncbi:hypothetical protein [Streptosporangium sp. NPDC000396]|uniref:hypothetical protein n=1 Tax=Streptosporangium sp. NPDC000396 TaxID=3366185 RepID=UPI0036B0DF4F